MSYYTVVMEAVAAIYILGWIILVLAFILAIVKIIATLKNRKDPGERSRTNTKLTVLIIIVIITGTITNSAIAFMCPNWNDDRGYSGPVVFKPYCLILGNKYPNRLNT